MSEVKVEVLRLQKLVTKEEIMRDASPMEGRPLNSENRKDHEKKPDNSISLSENGP